MLLTKDDMKQFLDEGYFVLERAIPGPDLAGLRLECQQSLDTHVALMERVGAETLGLTHKEKRYTLPCWHEERPFLQRFLFGNVMMEIVRSTVGDNAYLFLELFSLKWPRTGTALEWHQDSGYLLGIPHKPYISLWCALDDMTEENGCLYVLPYSRAESKDVVQHIKDKKTNDLIGYSGTDLGTALLVPAGSIVGFSSTTFHRSGANLSDQPRRAFLASYSSEPITDKKGNLWNLAVPFIENGARVIDSDALD